MATCRELIIIDGKCYDIKNLGWNPKVCNPQLKEMVEGLDLRAKFFYVRKNSNDRHAYTLEQLAAKYQMGILQNELWEIINRDYETFEVEADWNKEFPKSDEIKWEE